MSNFISNIANKIVVGFHSMSDRVAGIFKVGSGQTHETVKYHTIISTASIRGRTESLSTKMVYLQDTDDVNLLAKLEGTVAKIDQFFAKLTRDINGVLKNLEDALNGNHHLQKIAKNSDKALKEKIEMTQRAFVRAYENIQKQVVGLRGALEMFMVGIKASTANKDLQARMKALDASVAQFTQRINNAIKKMEDFLDKNVSIQSTALASDKKLQETIETTKLAFFSAVSQLNILTENLKEMLEGLDESWLSNDGLFID